MDRGENRNYIYDFFRNLCCRGYTEEEPLQYTLVLDNKESFELVYSCTNPAVLRLAFKLQERAYRQEQIRDNECVICLEENISMIPLFCKHSICYNCFRELLLYNYTKCPVCNMGMKLISKCYTIITHCPYGYGIIYLPPIFMDDKDMWLDHEIVASNNYKRLANICQQLMYKNYILIVTSKEILHIINKVKNEVAPALKINTYYNTNNN